MTRAAIAFCIGFALTTPPPASSQEITIFFDGSGAEEGITERGTTSFSFMGSNWSGGVVETEGILPLYASGEFSYEIVSGNGTVTFDQPIDSVRFFYVHGFGFDMGTATAFDAGDDAIGSADSLVATNFADPANFVTIDPAAPIRRIEFSGGVIDNFSYTISTGPTETPAEPTATPTEVVIETPTPTATLGPVPCVGDCNGDGSVTVDELVRGVNIALGGLEVGDCPDFDSNEDGRVTIDELIGAVNAALSGCVVP